AHHSIPGAVWIVCLHILYDCRQSCLVQKNSQLPILCYCLAVFPLWWHSPGVKQAEYTAQQFYDRVLDSNWISNGGGAALFCIGRTYKHRTTITACRAG